VVQFLVEQWPESAKAGDVHGTEGFPCIFRQQKGIAQCDSVLGGAVARGVKTADSFGRKPLKYDRRLHGCNKTWITVSLLL
jgi:hypothetical protein